MKVNKRPVAFITFTDAAENIKNRIIDLFPDFIPYERDEAINEGLRDFVKRMFDRRIPIVFVSAMGICVRHIAAFVRDKLTDSPVIVIDEKGSFVIPVLSGHVGGANCLAESIAEKLEATSVITTATDVEGIISIDSFAAENGYRIVNRDGIKKVSARLLRGESSTIFLSGLGSVKIDSNDTKEGLMEKLLMLKLGKDELFKDSSESDIILARKRYVLGIGVRRGKSFEDIKDFIWRVIPDYIDEVRTIASIDIKSDEIGLIEFSNYLKAEFEVFSADELAEIEGDFSESDFVRETLGVGNVCERAACLASKGGNRIIAKIKGNGVTAALYEEML